MATVEVESRVAGPRTDEGLRNVFFETGAARMTVRELILRTVEEQVRDLNARRELTRQDLLRRFARQYQTEDEIRELRDATGRGDHPARFARPAPIQLDAAQHHALEAFTEGRCVIFVGNEQMSSLAQEIELGASTKVQFLRVLPLQGGA